MIALGLGCWQEVRYEPDKPDTQSQHQAVETKTGEPTQVLLPQTNSETLLENSTFDNSTPEMPEPADFLPVPQPAPASVPGNETANETEVETVVEGDGDRYPQAEASSPEGEVDRGRMRLAAWEMSSRWSMAAAYQAKGRDEESFGERLSQARHDARLLGVDLPELPSYEVGDDRLSGNLTFLLEQAGPHLARELRKTHGEEHAALMELATKTHVLLLSYTPNSTELEPVIAAIRLAAESSGLPEKVWRELLDLLTSRADFKQVKAAVFGLHRQAVDALSSESE